MRRFSMTSWNSVVVQVANANAIIAVVASVMKPVACAAAITTIRMIGRSTNCGSSAMVTAL